MIFHPQPDPNREGTRTGCFLRLLRLCVFAPLRLPRKGNANASDIVAPSCRVRAIRSDPVETQRRKQIDPTPESSTGGTSFPRTSSSWRSRRGGMRAPPLVEMSSGALPRRRYAGVQGIQSATVLRGILSRLRGRSHFGAAKALPLSSRGGEGEGAAGHIDARATSGKDCSRSPAGYGRGSGRTSGFLASRC